MTYLFATGHHAEIATHRVHPHALLLPLGTNETSRRSMSLGARFPSNNHLCRRNPGPGQDC